MSTIIIPELALQRYREFIESFNKFKLIDSQIDISAFNYEEKLKEFYVKISSDDKLFKYLLNREKVLFHKNYKIVFMPKINLYNFFESKIDEALNSFVWESMQMLFLIISDNQENKNQNQVNLLLDKLDGLGKKKGVIDVKKISSMLSNINSSVLTDFLTTSGLDSNAS